MWVLGALRVERAHATSTQISLRVMGSDATFLDGHPKLSVQPSISPDERERLFAAWLGLAAAMLAARLSILVWSGERVPLLPVAAYQDLGLVAVVAWAFWLLLESTRNPRARGAIATAGWVLCLIVAFCSALSAIFYNIMGDLPSYRLLFTSDQYAAAGPSIRRAVSLVHVIELGAAPAFVVVAAWFVSRFAPAALKKSARNFHSLRGLECVAVFLVLAHLSAPLEFRNPSTAANAELRFVSSLFAPKEAAVQSPYIPAVGSDFLPVGERLPDTRVSPMLGDIRRRMDPAHPMNIVMVIMESVGTHHLQLYGSRFKNTPELMRLSRHAAMFTRIYAPQAMSSNAMAAIFCSLYPPHFWQTITWTAPELPVPGLASVLAGRRYRALFLHSNNRALEADHEKRFLLSHGFNQIQVGILEPPRDDLMIPAAIQWIGADRSRPFLLAIWTDGAHQPYVSDRAENYGVSDGDFNRYLNAVRSTDALIGELEKQMEAMGLADNTLLVISGDHGEAFHEHGNLVHGFTVYDEEVHIPLLLVNGRLFPEPVRINEIGQQVDIAPTVLDVLGYSLPAQWQGRSLFASDRVNRAYLFANRRSFMFGLVDGDLKYIYDLDGYDTGLYDLSRDPAESANLIHDSHYALEVEQARSRIAAWRDFQDLYLAGLARQRPNPRP